ncbi:ITGA9 [Acanthosepion pharaonis]|uniref:ITGA9 n=1 Tax=Acanthosepion pharaonis TaxID=158019 RepID=A0A812BT74_ACAPH|nr:ITGA9 [Sepia pharaonis]
MLFECQISGQESTEKYQKCTTQVALSGDSSADTQSYDEKQWLGVAMDVNEQAGKFIVCAHRWCEIVSKQLRMVGACYLLSTSINDHKILAPLLDKPKKNGVFYQGMAQFGTSAQFSKNNKDILFGAPGIYQGRGGFVIKDILNDNFTTVDYSNSENHKVYSKEEYEDSMVGYSITSGRFFFNKIQIAVGGPGPSTFGLGKVLIYSGEMLIGRYAGSQYGGGFGSSLASGNFSGDEHDDLVVGAPMEYDVVDEGRVYILISTGLGSFMENKIVLVGDNIPGSRFGTTVANIGDLNQDGIDDIAVGAPYENGCGAVYIYYGNLISIDEIKRQKIIGKSLSPELKGFGISFSRPKDVDNNGYLDFAVGAFLSDQAVLLHTKPVIKSNTTVQSSPSELNPQDTDCFGDIFKDGCLNLSVSINLLGKAFKKVDLEVSIYIDVEKNENQKRAVLQKAEDNYIQTELGLNNQFHKIYQLKTRKRRDLFKPVVINLIVTVQTNETEMNISPIQDLLNPNIIKYEIPFLNDCGADKLCAVDLQTRLKCEGFEMYPKNNEDLLNIQMRKKAVLSVNTVSEPQYILVSQKKESKSATDIKDITHQYSFYNNGPSDLKAGNFTLKVYKIGSLLSNLDPQVNSSGTFLRITCLSETFNNKPQFYEMKCHFREWLKESLFLIEVYMKMDIAKLDSMLPVVKSELIMNSVKDKDYVDDVAIEGKIYSVSTNFRSPGQPKPVKTWIIVLCVVLGILLLLGFIAGLWKCGFFKRQKVHRIRQHDGSMKQEVQPDPDSEPLN